MKDKLYIIKKYVKAPSAAVAIKREKRLPVDDVWVDDDWAKGQRDRLADAVGFQII